MEKSRNVRLPFVSSQNSMNTRFPDTNLTGILPQWLLWGSCKNLYDCFSTLVINGTSLLSALIFQNILHLSIYFDLVSDSCYCYPTWWRCSLSNSTFQHRWTKTPCLFKLMKNDEHVAMLFQCLLDHTQQKLYFSFCCWEITFQSVYTSIWDTLYIWRAKMFHGEIFQKHQCV